MGLVAAMLASGCGSGTTQDAGVDDAGLDGGVRTDGSTGFPDGSVVLPDGAILLPDGAVVSPDQGVGTDGGTGTDGGMGTDGGTGSDGGGNVDTGVGTVDAGTPLPDLGIPEDAGELPMECFDGNGDIDVCGCLVTTDCASTACPQGTTCEDDGCGGVRCLAAGHPCVDNTDCPGGGTCTSTAAGNVCRPPGPDCRDDRECPLGFTCESTACVDRRVYCDATEYSCPVGYVCDFATRQGQAFCRRLDQACEHAETCPQPGACIDFDGDGSKECVPPELLCVASSCTDPGRICGPQPEEKGYQCGFLGSCADQACDSPFVCTDFAGDGRPFCAPAGACDAHTDCSPR